jgi:hypothetical protein
LFPHLTALSRKCAFESAVGVPTPRLCRASCNPGYYTLKYDDDQVDDEPQCM